MSLAQELIKRQRKADGSPCYNFSLAIFSFDNAELADAVYRAAERQSRIDPLPPGTCPDIAEKISDTEVAVVIGGNLEQEKIRFFTYTKATKETICESTSQQGRAGAFIDGIIDELEAYARKTATKVDVTVGAHQYPKYSTLQALLSQATSAENQKRYILAESGRFPKKKSKTEELQVA